jgi:hypothetical protein
LAALHAPLDDGTRHANVRHPADAVACELATDDEAAGARRDPRMSPLPAFVGDPSRRSWWLHLGRLTAQDIA